MFIDAVCLSGSFVDELAHFVLNSVYYNITCHCSLVIIKFVRIDDNIIICPVSHQVMNVLKPFVFSLSCFGALLNSLTWSRLIKS
jgi:hypothetical protein